MLISCIVPRLPPMIDGVGDYALRLSQQLRQDFGIKTHFIVGDPNWHGSTTIDGFTVDKLEQRSASNVVSLLLKVCRQTSIVLLHYVGHGYARRGCPKWLIAGLEQWKTNAVDVQLVTMFHELYASGGPIWRSNFWSSPIQKDLASRVAQLSDRCLTSNQGYARSLEQLSRGKHTQIPTIPVLCNIGEPENILPLSKRQKRLVVFGQTDTKLRVYKHSLPILIQACETLDIKEIWDVGPSTGLNLAALSPVDLIEIGPQSAPEISNILANSLAGFFDYEPERLAKSGIFAAYCSHGIIPINARGNSSLIDGVASGKHYLDLEKNIIVNNMYSLQEIANNAYSWYQTHRLSVQAKLFASQIDVHLLPIQQPKLIKPF